MKVAGWGVVLFGITPAQLAVTISPAIIADATNTRISFASARAGRLRAKTKIPASAIAQTYRAILPGPGNEPRAGISVPLVPAACTVKVVATAPPAGVTLGGLKLQLAPAGNPEHARPTACLNPFLGVTVIVKVPEAPFATVSDELLIASE